MEGMQEAHIAILATPGMGHLIPQVELAKRLLLLHRHLSITLVVVSIDDCSNSVHAVLDSLPKAVNTILLPPVPSTAFPEGSTVEAQFSLAIHHSLPSLARIFKASSLLLSNSNPIVALVVDIFGVSAFEVARRFGIAQYVFNLTSLTALAFALYFPSIAEDLTCDPKDVKEALQVPGCCVGFHATDIPHPVKDRSKDSYALCLKMGRLMKEADGILVNSFRELEPVAAATLEEDSSIPPVYAVGPLVQTTAGSSGGGDDDKTTGSKRMMEDYLRWLDKQPRGSVLFVCFGSGGTLSPDQMTELAWGLEMSGHRFLWVVRAPDEKMANAAYLMTCSGTASATSEYCDFLPKGFVARTEEIGMVVPSWVPQQQVLSHCSTGGFLSHCGWNSTLESIVNGVAMIAWPLFAEQNLNAVVLAEDLKVAIRPKVSSDGAGLVGREEIANAIKNLMGGEEGKMLKKRMQELKEASAAALEEDGSSRRAMSEVVHAWRKLMMS